MAPVDSEASPSGSTHGTIRTFGPTPGTRLVIFAALLLPSALVPLFVLRRSVNQLHRKIDELKGATNNLHQEFKTVMLELSIRRKQHGQLRAMIGDTRVGLANLRKETQRTQAMRTNWEHQTREQIQGLVASNRIQTSRLRELGTSLADVAAFMQEVELQQGFFSPRIDGKGIERLRFLAMQFERMGKTKDNSADVSPSPFIEAQ
ncbi:hypothetical protein H4582DRAFT_1801869 [Lactarius indigo]|nr:hypothetical protein H4582DRAFT_1801869 [Lactarius indigo]